MLSFFYALVIFIVIQTLKIIVLVIIELLETPISEKISLSIMKFFIGADLKFILF